MKRYSRWCVPAGFEVCCIFKCDNGKQLKSWIRQQRIDHKGFPNYLVDFFTTMNNKPYTGFIRGRFGSHSIDSTVEAHLKHGWIHNDKSWAWRYISSYWYGEREQYYTNGKKLRGKEIIMFKLKNATTEEEKMLLMAELLSGQNE